MDKIDYLTSELHKAQKSKNKDLEVEKLFDIAKYYYDEKEFEIMKQTLKQILEIDAKAKDTNYMYALALINENKDNEAQKYLKRELKINPKNKKAQVIYEKLEISTNFPIVTIVTTLIFIGLFFYFSNNFVLNYTTYLKYSLSSFNQNIFSAITSIFMHINLGHLVFNCGIFLIFGLYLEKYIGSVRFAILFLVSALLGNFIQSILTPENFVIGASSGIFGILGAVVMKEPLLKTKLLGIFNVPIIFILGIIFAIEGALSGYVLGVATMGDFAHIFGFLSGVLITAIFYYKTISNFYNWLAMAFGFWIIVSSLKGILGDQSFETIFSLGLTSIVGLFLIVYSYIKLKYVTSKVIENE